MAGEKRPCVTALNHENEAPVGFSGGGFVLELGVSAFFAFVDGIEILRPGFADGKAVSS